MSSGPRSRSPRGQKSGSSPCTPNKLTDESGRNPAILAYGIFGAGVKVYHGEWTTKDKDSQGSHLKTLKKIFTGSDTGTLDCSIEGCDEKASVGAHVYYSDDPDAAADVCEIIPTCSVDNHVAGVWKRGQAWSQGKGVDVKDGTPFTVRKIKGEAMAVKGGHGKGGGKGAGGFPIQNGLRNDVSEFQFYQSQADALCDVGILIKRGSGPFQLP